MVNTHYENFEYLALQCFSEVSRLLKNERFNNFTARIKLIESHKESLERVVSDLRKQAFSTLATSVISATANILSGLSGFTGPRGLGYFTNKTVDSISKTLGAIGGTADAFGRTITSFQETDRYKDQTHADQIDKLIRELDRQIDDKHQTTKSFDNSIESIINTQREANRKITSM
jgi:hypothetical protein